MTTARDFARFAPALQQRHSAGEDVLDQHDTISLTDLAREERFAEARRMPTDD